MGTASIILGSIIYVLWRDQNLLMFLWFDTIGMTHIIVSLWHLAPLCE